MAANLKDSHMFGVPDSCVFYHKNPQASITGLPFHSNIAFLQSGISSRQPLIDTQISQKYILHFLPKNKKICQI